MRRLALVVLCLTTAPLLAQNNRAAAPQLPFKIVDDFFQIPDTIWMAEAVGVALNSKGNIFILNRGNHPIESISKGTVLYNRLR